MIEGGCATTVALYTCHSICAYSGPHVSCTIRRTNQSCDPVLVHFDCTSLITVRQRAIHVFFCLKKAECACAWPTRFHRNTIWIAHRTCPRKISNCFFKCTKAIPDRLFNNGSTKIVHKHNIKIRDFFDRQLFVITSWIEQNIRQMYTSTYLTQLPRCLPVEKLEKGDLTHMGRCHTLTIVDTILLERARIKYTYFSNHLIQQPKPISKLSAVKNIRILRRTATEENEN